MGRKDKELSSDVKEVVWRLLEQGNSIQKAAEKLGIPFTKISCLKRRRIVQWDSVENIKRSGRPLKWQLATTGYMKGWLRRTEETFCLILHTNLIKMLTILLLNAKWNYIAIRMDIRGKKKNCCEGGQSKKRDGHGTVKKNVWQRTIVEIKFFFRMN